MQATERLRLVALLAIAAGSACGDSGSSDTDVAADAEVADDAWGEDDAGTPDDAPPDADGEADCTPAPELCNGADDDCDTTTDEDFDLATDPANCGECGVSCSILPNADGACEDAGGVILACHAGYVDANRSAGDGCEYECARTADVEADADGTCSDGIDNDCDTRTDATDPDCSDCVPEFCDWADNDCDTLIDEDFDLDFDPVNCGRCGTVCPARPNAAPICVLGECDIRCEQGWEDRDGRAANGCETACVPAEFPDESRCDGRDDDCDGLVDEEFAGGTCGAGACLRREVCHRGRVRCDPRPPPAPIDATCDGIDEDCDGDTDEDWVPAGCVGACAETAACTGGVPACGVPALSDATCDGRDDDCDGRTDEEYAERTCGRGACARTSECSGGVERCEEGTPSIEVCNLIDDDCDGLTDEGCGCSPGPWIAGTIDTFGNTGQHTSIVSDSAGALHASYYDVSNADLRYAHHPPQGFWTTGTVAATGDVGRYASA
ncbi:MAG: MopE-related protein, partial [Myxococcota bacterium]|nr:MopE-related protein [Myxococcota bacterium]